MIDFPRAVACVCLAGALASCMEVVETRPLYVVANATTQPVCSSALGAYYLPKGLLKVSAQSVDYKISLEPDSVTTTLVADQRRPLCLDYLASGLSSDVLMVKRTPAGLLESVSSDVEDRAPQIAQKLIVAGANFAIAARSGESTVASKNDKVDLAFDPFDPVEMQRANKALSRFGFCLLVEADGVGTPSSRGGAGCGSVTSAGVRAARSLAEVPLLSDASSSNILYRANQSFRVVILRKKDPESVREPWSLYLTKQVELPNLSPVFGVGVQRAMFAQRKTTLTFDNGVLNDVTVEKGSELLGFVSIPLVLAQAVADVPTKIVQLRLATTDQHAQLIDSQGKLIEALAAYHNAAQQAASTVVTTATADAARAGGLSPYRARVGEFMGACMDAGSSQADCARMQKQASF